MATPSSSGQPIVFSRGPRGHGWSGDAKRRDDGLGKRRLVPRLKWMSTSATSSLMQTSHRRLIETMRSKRKFGKRHSCLLKLFRQSAVEST
jgi:hypothetical protein